jgi:hypothetical protein
VGLHFWFLIYCEKKFFFFTLYTFRNNVSSFALPFVLMLAGKASNNKCTGVVNTQKPQSVAKRFSRIAKRKTATFVLIFIRKTKTLALQHLL